MSSTALIPPIVAASTAIRPASRLRPPRHAATSGLVMPVAATGQAVNPMAPALLLVGALVVDRRAVLGPGERRGRNGVDAQVHPMLVQRADRVGRHEAHARARRVDQKPVEDVLLA